MKRTDLDAELPDPDERPGLYPIRVVAAQTGLGVHTLRAWERRYGLPRPTRTAGEHRLYRAEDIVLLRRVQALIARGTPPSRACALVLAEHDAGRPAPEAAPAQPAPDTALSPPVLGLRAQLRAAFVALDDESADAALGEAFSLFGTEQAIEQVVMPSLADVGTAWAEGRASVAAEHFATTMVRARLLAAFEQAGRNERRPAVLLGAGPGDQHEMPALALALLLRRRGWRAIYLGPNTPLEALRDATARTGPSMICLSVTTAANVPSLTETLRALHRLPERGGVLLAYGGAPFRTDPGLREPLAGIATYLGDTLTGAAERAHALLLDDHHLLPSLS